MYSNVLFDSYKSEVHYWEYENGEKVHKVAPAPLYFFVESDQEDDDGYKTIFGKNAKIVEETKWWKYKEKREKYREWGMKLYESDVPIETKFIVSNYLGQDLTVPNFDIHYLDIEVHSEEGFPRPEDASFPITIITVWSTKHEKFFVFAERDFDIDFIINEGEAVEKFIFNTEAELLQSYMEWTAKEHPDILTGWNSNGYDIPYIMNRAVVLFGDEGPNMISPVEKVRVRHVPVNEYKIETRWTIGGISTLDMLEVYKNYTFSEQESWKLNYIAQQEECGGKVEYDGSLADLYKDWQKYVEYNVQDVRLLRKLEDKKKFIPLLISFCYGCRVPFEHYDRTTKVLDGAFISSLAADRVVLPDVDREMVEKMKEKDEKYVGGFVKHPLAGLHDWVVSFDATSLYPSIMMGWNISPETKLTVIPQVYVKDMMRAIAGTGSRDVQCVFFGESTTCGEVADYIKEQNYSMAANGTVYRQDKQGIVPKFVEEWFNKRKAYKKKMLAAQSHGDKEAADKYHALQLNYKILINSVYGYLGTPHSRFFDWDNAVAVTMSGRYITMTTGASIEHHFKSGAWENSKFGKKVGAKEGVTGTVIYADTDSVYLNFGKIMHTYGFDYENKDPEVVKNYIVYDEEKSNDEMGIHLDMSDEELGKYADMEEAADSLQNHTSEIINEAMRRLTLKHFNCNTNKIFFKREAVAQRGIFLERKRYVMWALNNEGVELPLKKRLKVTGIDIVRSNVPKFVRENLKKVVSDILTMLDHDYTIEQLREMHSVFFSADPKEIAFTKTANNVSKYKKRREELGKFKSTPQQVRGAILYNELLDSDPKLRRVYDKIYDGDKMSYVYTISSPIWESDVFAYKDKWLKGMGYEQIIDRRRQFDVAMLNPVRRFFDLLDWSLPDFENCDMSDMFEW